MADEQLIKPRELPAATTVFANDAIMTDDGVTVGKATPVQIVNAGAPVPTEAEAIAGTDNSKRMTPLTVKQVLDSVTAPSVMRAAAWAESGTPPDPGIPGSMSAKSWAEQAKSTAEIMEKASQQDQYSLTLSAGQTVVDEDADGNPIVVTDVADVYVDGFLISPGVDYEINSNGNPVLLKEWDAGKVVRVNLIPNYSSPTSKSTATPPSASLRYFVAEPYDSVAAVLASKQITADLSGQRIHIKGGIAYDVLPADAATWDQETAGGVKLALVTDLGDVTAAALPNLSEAVKVSRSKNLNIKVTGTFSANAVQLRDESIYGPAQITATSGSASALKLGVRNQHWKYKRLTDLTIDGSGKTSKGIVFDNGGADNHLSGRWILSGGRVQASSIGIEKPSGNIGNAFYEVNVTGNDIGYKATDAVGSVMHPGCDRFFGGHWSYNAIAAAYINGDTVGTGQHVFSGTIFEANPGFGIYVNNYRTGYTPLALLDVWFEGNATATSVMVDGVAKTPKDVFMRNTAAAVIERSTVRKFQFDAAHVLINASYWDEASVIEADSASVVRATNAFMDGYKGGQVIESLLRANREAGNFAAAHGAPARTSAVKKPTFGEVKLALSYDGGAAYTLSGSSTITSTQEADGGELRDYAAQFSQPVGGTHLTSSVTLPANKWFVYTFDWKQISGAPQSVGFVDGGTLATFPVAALAGGRWKTMGGVARTASEIGVRLRIANSASATEANVFRVRNVQIVQFDTESDAVAYYNSHAVVAALPVSAGGTSDRPTRVSAGYQFYDTTLNKPVWWTGSAWVDATGTTA